MSEQAPAAQDTPEVAGPPGTPGADQQQEIDWAKRYSDLQPEYTRVSQEAAQLRQQQELYQLMVTSDDPDTRRQAAEALGFQVEDEQDTSQQGFVDPYDQRLSQLEQAIAQQSQQAQQQAVEQRDIEIIGTGLRGLQEQLGRDLTEREIQLLGDSAWQNRTENGLPNIEAVAAMYREETEQQMEQRLKDYQRSKRAPHISSNGQSATSQPNVDDMTQQERHAYMAAKLAELEADT